MLFAIIQKYIITHRCPCGLWRLVCIWRTCQNCNQCISSRLVVYQVEVNEEINGPVQPIFNYRLLKAKVPPSTFTLMLTGNCIRIDRSSHIPEALVPHVQVRLKHICSASLAGVPQGFILGPLLFFPLHKISSV